MTNIIICAILSGIVTIFITSPLWNKKPRTCYLLMVIIPISSLFLFIHSFPQIAINPHIQHVPITQNNNIQNNPSISLQEIQPMLGEAISKAILETAKDLEIKDLEIKVNNTQDIKDIDNIKTSPENKKQDMAQNIDKAKPSIK